MMMMAEANEGSREMARSNSCVFPRYMLQRFMSNSAEGEDDDEEEEEEEEEIELNMALSLGGRFGVDISNKLVRSSSVVVTMALFREDHQPETKPSAGSAAAVVTTPKRHTGLMRTKSLPSESESEEEWRKKKEMQTLRRMAAKRRRSKKIRSSSGNNKAEGNINNNPEEGATTSRRRGRPSSGLPRWSAMANKSGLLRQHSAALDSLQGSVESQGGTIGSSSSVSELETKSNHQATAAKKQEAYRRQHSSSSKKQQS